MGNINACYENNEALFVCRNCLNTLNSYSNSFNEIRKVLMQYLVPTGECNPLMTARLN